jgi:hypothetical protein
MAGVAPGDAPAAVTNTWNEVPVVGAGVHWKAQPIFQFGTVMVKAGLVQLPWSWVGPSSNRAGGVDVVVVEPVVVEVDEPAVGAEVVVDAPPVATVVPVELPPAGGSVYAPPPEVPVPLELPEPPAPTLPLIAIPASAANTTATASCQVFHERFSLRPREPGAGTGLGSCGRTGPMATGS